MRPTRSTASSDGALQSASSLALLNNLPPQGSTFVGRSRELEQLGGLVRSHRLVTIAGPGGIGKTRLALQFGRSAIGVPDGVWFTSLKPVDDPAHIVDSVAQSLGVEADAGALRARVFEHLRQARALLILDNAEHLVADLATFVHELLQAAPHVSLIVTSQHVLHLEGEQVLRLGGIDDGVRLFTDRAYPAAPAPSLNTETVNAIASICAKVQGWPLAIELVAARAASIPPEQLVRALDSISPDGPVLAKMVEWSYRLLQRDERLCFDAIALFESAFSWEAVEAIARPAGHNSVALLNSLVLKSLVASSRTGDTTEYYLLEVVREYARDLERGADAEAFAARYVDYYFGSIEALTSEGVEVEQMIAALGREWKNIQGALRYAIDDRVDAHRACLVVPRLWRFWVATGRSREGLEWISRALGSGELPRSERLDLLDAAVRMAAASQQYAELEPLAQRLVDDREQGDDAKALGDALFMLGNAKHHLALHDEADALYRRALEQYGVSGSRRGTALVLGTIGVTIMQRTDSSLRLEEARDMLVQSLQIFREERNMLSTAEALENLGVACTRLGDLGQALAYLQESLALYQQHGNALRVADAHTSIADVYLALGQPLQALFELQVGRRTLQDDYQGPCIACYVESAFKAAVDLGAFEIAARLYDFAQAYRRLIRVPLQAGDRTAIAGRYAVLCASSPAIAESAATDGPLDIAAIDALVNRLASDTADSATEQAPESGAQPRTIERGRVSLRIRSEAAHPVVFIAAGGAWGKSIALDHYLESTTLRPVRVRLEAATATLDAFVELFQRALATALPSTAFPASRESDEPAATLLTQLSEYRGAIVVDNLHHAEGEPRIGQLLFNAARETKARIQWFLLSRQRGQAPIGTCIAYGLTGRPIDEQALAFTLDEVMEYARSARIPISKQECERIVELTEGWPLAVNVALRAQLAAIAMAPVERAAYVERETASLVSYYLREEVFPALSPRQRRFLLTAAAMPGDVAIEVMRQLDPFVDQTISELGAVTPTKLSADGAYRLAPLFKRFLQSELGASPDRDAACAELAAAYRRIGDPVSAIKVLLDFGRYDAALDITIEHAEIWGNGDWPNLLELVVARLPAQYLDANPAVLLARAAVADRRNRFDQALQLLDHARSSPDSQLRLRIACAEAALCINNEQPATARHLEVAIAQAAEDPIMQQRAKALLCLAYCDEREFQAARALSDVAAAAAANLVVGERTIDIVYWTALACYRLADYDTAKRLASQVTLSGHRQEPWLVLAQAHDLLSQIAANAAAPFDEVVQHNGAAIVSSRKLGNARYHSIYLQRRCALLFYNGVVGLVDFAMNQDGTNQSQLWKSYSAIFRFLTEIQQAGRAETLEKSTAAYADALLAAKSLPSDPVLAKDPFIPLACLMMTGSLANDQGVKEIAGQTIERAGALLATAESDGALPALRRHATVARVAAIVSQALLGEHQPLAQITAQLEARTNDPIAEAVATIARGIVYAIRGRKPPAQRARKKGQPGEPIDDLDILRNAGYGTIAALLAAIAQKSTSVVATGVALSKTETEILRQMANSLSVAEIAAARHLSIKTVRTHLKNLYRKLDVNSASAAINRGRSLGLL